MSGKHKGFTVIQILIAMVIFCILAGIAFYGSNVYINQANYEKADADLKMYQTVVETAINYNKPKITNKTFSPMTLNKYMDAGDSVVIAPDPVTGILYGDVNGDGKIDSKDTELLSKSLAGSYGVELTEPQRKAADVNGDGTISSADTLLIKKFVNGEIDHFPVETAKTYQTQALDPWECPYRVSVAYSGAESDAKMQVKVESGGKDRTFGTGDEAEVVVEYSHGKTTTGQWIGGDPAIPGGDPVTPGEDPVINENLIPDGAVYTVAATGEVLEGNGVNEFPETPATSDTCQSPQH